MLSRLLQGGNRFIYGISSPVENLILSVGKWCLLREVDEDWETVMDQVLNQIWNIFKDYSFWSCNRLFCNSVWLPHREKRAPRLFVFQWLDKGLDSAKIGRKRVSVLSSGAFNRKGSKMVHCFLSLRCRERLCYDTFSLFILFRNFQILVE